MKPAWLYRVFDAFSQLLNVLFYNGEPNYSMCGDAHRYDRKTFILVLDFIMSVVEKDHCRLSYEADIQRARDYIYEAEHKILKNLN